MFSYVLAFLKSLKETHSSMDILLLHACELLSVNTSMILMIHMFWNIVINMCMHVKLYPLILRYTYNANKPVVALSHLKHKSVFVNTRLAHEWLLYQY